MSPSHPADVPTGATRRAVLLTGGAIGILAGLGALRPARADAVTPAAMRPAAPEERPHRTLLGVL